MYNFKVKNRNEIICEFLINGWQFVNFLSWLLKHSQIEMLIFWIIFYVSLVRIHLEYLHARYGVRIFLGQYRNVRESTKKSDDIIQLENFSYEERLNVWGINSLLDRRIIGDLYKRRNALKDIYWFTGSPYTKVRWKWSIQLYKWWSIIVK